MILIASLPHFLPVSAVIQIHTIIQLLSNSSRAALSWRSIEWKFVKQHAIGSLLGITIGGLLFTQLNLSFLPILIGTYILLHLWSKRFSETLGKLNNFYVIGSVHTFIATIAGAPGPIPLPLLLRKLNDHHTIVCTMALFMTIGHLLKLFMFMMIGFDFLSYWPPILCMTICTICGSIIGTKLRQRIDNKRYIWIAKTLLTVLACSALFSGFHSIIKS